jgi:hypothetical protein
MDGGTKMKLICKYLGGSHSYGLNSPESDIDYRGIFLNDSVAKIIGLDRHEHQLKQDQETDEAYKEFRRALQLLRKSNTEMVEMLFNDNWIEISPDWKFVQENKYKLMDSAALFSCLRGYMQGERRLANGERTGKLGGKRKEAIDKYGFSPKNFVQLFRLAWAGKVFFETSVFPVNVRKFDEPFANWLMTIKYQPQCWNKDLLNKFADTSEQMLITAYENKKENFAFDSEFANKLCLRIYLPILQGLNGKVK